MTIPFLSLATQAAKSRGAYNDAKTSAQKTARDESFKNAIAMLQAKRQAEQDALAKQLGMANLGKIGAETQALQNKPVTPLRDYVKEHQAIRDYDIEHPLPTETKPTAPLLGSPEYLAAQESLEKMRSKYRPPPTPSFTPITVGGGEGQPSVIKPFDTKSGTVGDSVGEAKPAPTRIESAINTAAKARLEAAVSEMNNAHAGMDEFETALANKTISINGLQQFLAATGNSFTHDDPASRAIQSAALATLNHSNPKLARYIRRGLSFAEGESMISQRPSDFRTKMAAFLSTAASGASPEMIHDIQSRRTSILNPLNRTVTPDTTTKAPAGNIDLQKAPTREQALWDAAVAKHGRAKVEQLYGPRPGGDE